MLVTSSYGLKLQWGNITLQPYTANSEIHRQGLWLFFRANKMIGRPEPPQKKTYFGFLSYHMRSTCMECFTYICHSKFIWYIHSILIFQSPWTNMHFWMFFFASASKMAVTSNGRTPCGAGFFGMLGDGGEASGDEERWGKGGFFWCPQKWVL